MVYARDNREPANTHRDYGLCRSCRTAACSRWVCRSGGGIPFMCEIVRSIFDGAWDSDAPTRAVNYWWGLRSGAEDLEYQEDLPSGTRQLLDLLETLLRLGQSAHLPGKAVR